MSMTLATSANGTLSSPLTNITFSARVLKISVRRPCNQSHVVSSLLIFTPGSWPDPRSINCTTIVRSGVLFLGALGGGGWGTSASRPFGVNGVITIKMMSSTSSTSISGVTLMLALCPPPLPIAILMVESPLVSLASLPRRWSGGRSVWSALSLFGEQAQIIHTSGAHSVHDLDYIAEVGAGVCLQVDLFVGAIGEAIPHLACQGINSARKFVGAEVDGSIAHHRNQQRVFFVRVLHWGRVVNFGHVDADALLQHGRDHHEDDQQHQHHVHHGGDVDVRVYVGPFVPLG